MRRFLRNIVLFSLLMAVGLGLCEWYVRIRMSVIPYKVQYIQEQGDGIATLVLGNSTVYWGFDPAVAQADSTFNIAYNGQPNQYSYLFLKNNLKGMPNLRRVLFGVTFCNFFDYPFSASGDWEQDICYTIYTGFGLHHPLSRCNFEIAFPERFRQLVLPWRTSQEYFQYDSLGHSTASPRSARFERWNHSVRWLLSQHVPPDWRFVPENVAWFDSIATFCKEKGLELIVFSTPLHHTLVEAVPQEQVSLHYRIINSRRQRYGFRFLDYIRDSRFTDDDFFDCVHLSTDSGATHFSRILWQDLNSPPSP